jgi:hypothetical protein
MQLYYYVYLFILLSATILFVYYILRKRKSNSVRLFVEALKNENSGHYQEALISYENALDEVNKVRFQATLKSKIVAKLKLLNTIIEFNKNFHGIP